MVIVLLLAQLYYLIYIIAMNTNFTWIEAPIQVKFVFIAIPVKSVVTILRRHYAIDKLTVGAGNRKS